MDAFLHIIPSSTCYAHKNENVMHIKNTVLPELRSKGAGKAFLIKIENKMSQTIRIL